MWSIQLLPIVLLLCAALWQAVLSEAVQSRMHGTSEKLLHLRGLRLWEASLDAQHTLPNEAEDHPHSLKDTIWVQGRRALGTNRRGTSRALKDQEEDSQATDVEQGGEGGVQEVTVVVTAQELQRAVVAGAPHIEIQDHLDLTTLPLLLNGRLLGAEEGVLPPAVKSITGSCEQPAPETEELLVFLPPLSAPLRHLLPGQCLLWTDGGLLAVENSPLWLQGLYVRMLEPRDGVSESVLLANGTEARVWLNNVRLQGNGDGAADCEDCGMVAVQGAGVLAEDCVLSDFDGFRVLRATTGSTASFVGCTLANINLVDTEEDVAVMQAIADPSWNGSLVRLEECIFSDNSPPSAPLLQADNRNSSGAAGSEAGFYADAGGQAVCQYLAAALGGDSPGCVQGAAWPLTSAQADAFMSADEEWVVGTKQAVEELPRVDIEPLPAGVEEQPSVPGQATNVVEARDLDTDDDDDDRVRNGIVAGVVALVLLVVGIAIAMYCRRHRKKQAVAEQQAADTVQPGSRKNSAVAADTFSITHASETPPPSSKAPSKRGNSSTLSTNLDVAMARPGLTYPPIYTPPEQINEAFESKPLHEEQSEVSEALQPKSWSKLWSPRRDAPIPPQPGATLQEHMSYVAEQLDCFGPGTLLLDKYQLLGRHQRRLGGGTIVQFAERRDFTTSATATGPLAMKFFANRADFDVESKMFRSLPRSLRQFLPKVDKYIDNKNGAMKDPFGNPLPPCIVMSRGQSILDKAGNSRVDVFSAAGMLSHAAQKIAELHETGYVHRDLKPENILFRESASEWFLIGFGHVAKAGKMAPLTLSLKYAAPETILAEDCGMTDVPVHPAVDAWALGVIAFELLVGKRSFAAHSESKIRSALADPGSLLPWEEGGLSERDRGKLGRLWGPMQKLLVRDPVARGSVQEFCLAARKVFVQCHGSRYQRTDSITEADTRHY